MTTTTVTWAQMTAAGLNIDHVHASPFDPEEWNAYDTEAATDAKLRVCFGTSPDPEHVVPEGGHPGWSATGYERDEHREWAPTQEASFEPEQVEQLLAFVKTWSE